MFKNTELEGMGINVNGENLNHLCFADDIVLISDSIEKKHYTPDKAQLCIRSDLK